MKASFGVQVNFYVVLRKSKLSLQGGAGEGLSQWSLLTDPSFQQKPWVYIAFTSLW